MLHGECSGGCIFSERSPIGSWLIVPIAMAATKTCMCLPSFASTLFGESRKCSHFEAPTGS